MRGSLVQLGDGYWRLRAYTGTRTPRGNPRQASRYFRGSKREAQTALAMFVTEVSQTKEWSDQRATVADLMTKWVEHLEARGRAAYTTTEYRRKMRLHIVPTLGTTKLSRLKPAAIDQAYSDWLASGLSPATVRKLHNMLGAACAQGVKWGWLRMDPTDHATPPSLVREAVGTMSVDDARALHEAAIAAEGDGSVMATAVVLGALTGARRGELCALRWNDVDWARGVVHIRRSLTVIGAAWAENATKTKKGRQVPLDERAMDVLRARHLHQLAEAQTFGHGVAPDAFVLSRDVPFDAPCLPNGVTHAFRRLADGLGLPWHFHDLRHFSVTAGLSAGFDVVTVAERHGHADAKMTLGTYGHVVAERARELGASMSDALGLP